MSSPRKPGTSSPTPSSSEKMTKIMLLLTTILCASCVAPSMTIYGVGTTVDGKTVAVKEAQIYGDLVGNTVIRGSVVTVSANGGY